MRVVYDTNILISAIFSQRSSPFRCLQLARDGIVQAVSCQEIVDEFQEKLLNKFSYDLPQAQAFVEEVRSYSQLVSITVSKQKAHKIESVLNLEHSQSS